MGGWCPTALDVHMCPGGLCASFAEYVRIGTLVERRSCRYQVCTLEHVSMCMARSEKRPIYRSWQTNGQRAVTSCFPLFSFSPSSPVPHTNQGELVCVGNPDWGAQHHCVCTQSIAELGGLLDGPHPHSIYLLPRQ